MIVLKVLKCRECEYIFRDGIDLFLHNYIGRCRKDSAIEYIEQNGGNGLPPTDKSVGIRPTIL